MENEKLITIMNKVKARLPKLGTHGYEHTKRVFKTCEIIGKRLKADLDILLPAALLHDIARNIENHAVASADVARDILESLGFTPNSIKAITAAISTHSFSRGISPTSLEAKILSDADKLDAMGAIGIYRAAMFSAENNRPISKYIAHFHEKLLNLRDTLCTIEAQHLAESRHKFMRNYLEQLVWELSLE
jgi:uncharacterized protein